MSFRNITFAARHKAAIRGPSAQLYAKELARSTDVVTHYQRSLAASPRSCQHIWPQSEVLQFTEATYCESACAYCIANAYGSSYEHIFPELSNFERLILKKDACDLLFKFTERVLPSYPESEFLLDVERCPVAYHTDPDLYDTVVGGSVKLDNETCVNLFKFCERMALKYNGGIERQGNMMSFNHKHEINSDRSAAQLNSFVDYFKTKVMDELPNLSLPTAKVTLDFMGSEFFMNLILKLASGAFLLYSLTTKNHIVISGALGVAASIFAPEQVAQIQETVAGWFKVEAQSGTFNISQLLGCFVLTDLVKKVAGGSGSYVAEFANRATIFGRQVNGLNELFDFLLGIVQKGLDACANILTGRPCPIRLVEEECEVAYKLINELLDLEAARASDTIGITECHHRLCGINDEFSALLVKAKTNSGLMRLLTPYSNMLMNALKESKIYLAANGGYRVQPSCIFLLGAAGIGKSYLSNLFAQVFATEMASSFARKEFADDPKTIGRSIFQYNPTDSYYSGYHGQPVFFIDEASAKPLTPSTPPLPAVLINMVNTIPMALNMADLNSKGTTFFSSNVILGTSNERVWSGFVVNDKAVYRRANFVDVVVSDAKYAKNPEDSPENWQLNKLAKDHLVQWTAIYEAGSCDFNEYIDQAYSILEFKIMDMGACNGQVHHSSTGEIMKPSELMAHIVSEFESNRTGHVKSQEVTARLVSELLAKRRIREQPKFHKVSPVPRVAISPSPGEYPVHIEAQGGKPAFFKCECAQLNTFESIAQKIVEVNKGNDEMFEDILYMIKNPVDFQGIVPMLCPCNTSLVDASTVHARVSAARFWVICARVELSQMTLWPTLSKVAGWVRAAASTMATVGMLVAGWKVIQSLTSSRPAATEQGDYNFVNKSKAAAQRKSRLRTVGPQVGPQVDPQSGAADPLFSLAESIGRSNQYSWVVRSPNTKADPHVGNLLLVQNNVAILPRHLVMAWEASLSLDKDATIEFTSPKLGEKCAAERVVKVPLSNLITIGAESYMTAGDAITIGQLFEVEDEMHEPDMIMIRVNLSGKNIMKHFLTRDQFESSQCKPATTGILSALRSSGTHSLMSGKCFYEGQWQTVCTGSKEPYTNANGQLVYDDDRVWFSDHLMKYQCPTAAGDCGSPFFTKFGGEHRIASIHVAGMRGVNTGYGAIVLLEDIQVALTALHDAVRGSKYQFSKDVIEMQGAMVKSNFVEANGSFANHTILGTVTPANMPTQTKIVKSPLHAAFEEFCPEVAPARLVPFVTPDGDLVNPMVNAQTGYGRGGTYPSVAITKLAVQSVWRTMRAACVPEAYEFELPSLEETVFPGSKWEQCASISRKTSPGYPYCLYTKDGKKYFFGYETDFDFTSSACVELFAEVRELEAAYVRGERPLIVCMSFLKDERRPLTRVVEGKTRLISASGLAFSILCRRYTMGFTNYLMRGRVANGSGVGVNAFSSDWTALARDHGCQRGVPTGESVAGDYSGFDKDLTPELISDFGDVMDCFYQDDGNARVIRRCILEEIAYSRHVVDGKVVQWLGSNTSGNPLTTPINTICNLIMVRTVCATAHAEHNNLAITEEVFVFLFENGKAIAITAYGDDNLITRLFTKDRTLDWFCQSAISVAMLRLFGIKYTDESKGKREYTEVRKITECSFLKRGFSYSSLVPGKRTAWLAPLELDTMYSSVMWTKTSDKDLEFWKLNVKNMIDEASLHSAEVYKEYINRVKFGLTDRDVAFEVLPDAVTTQRDIQIRVSLRDYKY